MNRRTVPRAGRPGAVKRGFDIAVSLAALLASAPVLVPVTLLVWRQDKHSPFYVAERIGKDRRSFRMVKIRSMVVGADLSGVDSTAADDMRITPVGRFIRRYKLDELTQFWNVLRGEMSLVGPRPNVRSAVDSYTVEERRLLSVRPGITDLASIVFSDEAEILRGSQNPDRTYDELIRPGKSRLGLYYVEHMSLWLDLSIVALTATAILSRESALHGVATLLRRQGAEPQLIELASRSRPLAPAPPPDSPVKLPSTTNCCDYLAFANKNDDRQGER